MLPRLLPLACLIAIFLASSARAVLTDDHYVTTPPAVEDWSSGWGDTTATGWDYVGQVGGASGVYLQNGWVLTAAHVGAEDFLLDNVSYALVAGSVKTLTGAGGTTPDLRLFQLASSPALPGLPISDSDPAVLTLNAPGSNVVMIGFGGGSKSWGANMVTSKNASTTPSGQPYTSIDFATKYGDSQYLNGARLVTVTNQAKVVPGDSGGAGFIYDSGAARWELAGTLEAVTSNGDSYLVQLDKYAAQINAITATPVPEPRPFWLLVAAVLPLALRARWRRES